MHALNDPIFIISTAFAIAVGVFRENKGRSWSLAANIAACRYFFDPKRDIHTVRYLVGGTTSQAYQGWARQGKQEILTDHLSEGAKLHWIGPRRDVAQDRVFLYFHGESHCLCITRQNVLISIPDLYNLQEEASSTPRNPTIFNSYALSRRTCLLEMLASLCWNTVSPVRFQRASLCDIESSLRS